MMHEEFEKLVEKKVTAEEYKVVEMVYTWHPAIKDTDGKRQIAMLYTEFGMTVIKAMLPVAEKMLELDGAKRELRKKMALIEEREQMLTEGDMELEEAIEKVNELFMRKETPEAFEIALKGLGYEKDLVATARKVLEV